MKLPGWEAAGDRRLAIVGKGVCFDSGGISLKGAERMEEMKHDKAGAAAVLAAARTVARLAPQTPLMAVAPMVENMPSGKAQRPGDVVKAMNGKTIEVINTDAEGRLILADALHWAETQGATHLVDVATLTGAAAVAFGDLISAYFAKPRDWGTRGGCRGRGDRRVVLGDAARDRVPRRPRLGACATSSTRRSREGSLIKSAVFISEFVTVPWVHVDIGGSAYLIRDKRAQPQGFAGHHRLDARSPGTRLRRRRVAVQALTLAALGAGFASRGHRRRCRTAGKRLAGRRGIASWTGAANGPAGDRRRAGGGAIAWRSTLPAWALLVHLLILAILVVLTATDLEQRRLPYLLLDALIVVAAPVRPVQPDRRMGGRADRWRGGGGVHGRARPGRAWRRGARRPVSRGPHRPGARVAGRSSSRFSWRASCRPSSVPCCW